MKQHRPSFQEVQLEFPYLFPLPLPPKPGIKRPETGRVETPSLVQTSGQTERQLALRFPKA